jgi:Xaa-Pro aminopeptidase
MTEKATAAVLGLIRPGMTERDVRRAFVTEAQRAGLRDDHIDHVWTVIPRSRHDVPWLRGEWANATPYHQLTSDRVLERGDLLTLDAGFVHQGYVTDVGWTFVVGREPNADERHLAERWAAVAHRVAAAVRPGATGADLRAAALESWAGDGNPWPHPLYVAHGIGFGTVEPPFAGTDFGPDGEARMVLEPGMVLLIEPYVWEEGIGGYRAELAVEVTDSGYRRLSTLPVEELRGLTG